MFTNTPYSIALAHGALQNELLNEICGPINSMEELNWKKIDKKIKEYDNKLANIF